MSNKWFQWDMAIAQAVEKHGNETDLTSYLPWGIYTSVPTWTHWQNPEPAVKGHRLNIASHGGSLGWSQRPSQSTQE